MLIKKETMAVPIVQNKPVFLEAQKVPKSRFKLWQLQSCWHCAVIGTCLKVTEVRAAAKKAKLDIHELTDFDVHQMSVKLASNSVHPLTRRLHKLLDSKFEGEIKKCKSAKCNDSLLQQWNELREQGKVAGGLWAVVTHPYGDSTLVQTVYGEVHMLSHLASSAANNAQDLVESLRREVISLRGELNDSIVQRTKKTSSMENKLRFVREQLASAGAELRKIKGELAKAHKAGLSSTILNSEKPDQLQQTQTDLSRRDVTRLKAELVEQQKNSEILAAANQKLERLLSVKLTQQSPEAMPTDLPLCGLRVLFLGGRQHLCRHFQKIVEQNEGEFLHHDGGIGEGRQRIAALVHKADAVLCPIDCISHNAMKKARRICENRAKPIVFMQSASLSSFVKGLQEISAKESSINSNVNSG